MTKHRYFKELYRFEDLDNESQDKAIERYRDKYDYSPFMYDSITEYITTAIEESGYNIVGNIEACYCLGHCQGDGVSFSGKIEDKDGKQYTITQSGRYCHAYTMDACDENDEEAPEVLEEMRNIAKKAEKFGYRYMEDALSDESLREEIKANEFLFTKDGKIDAYTVELSENGTLVERSDIIK
jgi:hypothetical protein